MKKPKDNGTPKVGTCKQVHNPRTGRCMDLCFVGKDQSRSGWKFKKGSSRACSRP